MLRMSATAMRIRTRASLNLVPLCIAQALLFVCVRNVSARAIKNDSVICARPRCWEGRLTCLEYLVEVDLRDFLGDAANGTMDACLCWTNELEEAVDIIDEKAVIPFTNYDDKTTAAEDFVLYPSTHSDASFSAIALPKTPESQSPSHNIREITGDSQSQPLFTSDLSPSHKITTSWPTTAASLTYPITNSSNLKNPVSSKTDSNDDRLKTSDIISMIVQILGLLIAVLTLWVSWKIGRPERLWQGVTVQYFAVQTQQV